jgi:pimeloyl-ACP methyl ester carboxylesterase
MRLSLKSEFATISPLDLLYEQCRSLRTEIQHPNYSPDCVEEEFCEVPLYGVLRSSRQTADRGTMDPVERLTRHWKKRVRKEDAMSTNPQDESQPSVVLVHGAWVDGSGWQGVYNQLKDDYSVRIVQEPNLSLEGDVAATKMILGQQSEPVVLVGHSYGGVVVTEAGNDPKVAALVYIAAFVPDQGETEETLIGTFPSGVPNAGDAILPPQDGFLLLDREKFHDSFAAGVSAEEAAFMADSQVP